MAKRLTRWAFRGQASAEWSLSSSLERGAAAVDIPRGLLANRESWMRIQFARRAHHYVSDPPAMERLIEWLALIQHHGGPTRLLDFTRSFYVAAFFALEFAAADSAVWAVNLERVEAFADRLLHVERGPKSTIHDRYAQYLAGAERLVSGEAGPRCVLPVEPERLNERLSIQQGLFLMACDITATFVENLAGSLEVSPESISATLDVTSDEVNVVRARDFALVKLLLPHAIQRDGLSDLRDMNISAATLFPGLDGFARSLHYHLHLSLTNPRLRAVGLA